MKVAISNPTSSGAFERTPVTIYSKGEIIGQYDSMTIANEDSLFSWKKDTNTIHLIFSAIFFVTLSVISFFLFTKSGGEKTKQKQRRNSVYKFCGVVIFVSTLLIGLFHYLDVMWMTLWLEWVGIIAFGVSWLIKGNTILKDGN